MLITLFPPVKSEQMPPSTVIAPVEDPSQTVKNLMDRSKELRAKGKQLRDAVIEALSHQRKR